MNRRQPAQHLAAKQRGSNWRRENSGVTSTGNSIIDFSSGNFVHLGLGATAQRLPPHTGDMEWYAEYGANHEADGAEGRLVSMHTFDASWDTWEMHPHGHEVVLCTSGTVTLLQELVDGQTCSTTIGPGEAVVNDPGVWHTADIAAGDTAIVVFITAGLGTEMRPRD